MHADIVITNANVLTMSDGAPAAQSVAVSGNRIVCVGTIEQAAAFVSADTQIIDAKGGTVMPGFIEAHMHLFGGAASTKELDLHGVNGLSGLTSALQGFADANPESELLVGHATDYEILGNGVRLTRQQLDEIIPERPVFLRSSDYHNAWVNTAALERAEALHGHETGPGSSIVMAEDGYATGELRESAAMEFVAKRCGQEGREWLGISNAEPDNLTAEERAADIETLKEGLSYCASLGITTIHNMDGNFYQCELLRDIENAGELSCRVEVPYHFTPSEPLENLSRASKMAEEYASNMLWSGRVKMFMDGVIDAWTAVMVDDYSDRQGERGTPLHTAERFNAIATEADKRGMQISVHAIGDGAVRMTLDGFEAATQANGNRDSRHRIEHIEVVHPDDIPRFKRLGVLASMQPIHAPGNGFFPNEPTINMIGSARWPYAYAWRTLKEAGAQVVFATDWPVAPLDPLRSIKSALLRKPWSEDLPDQRLGLLDTLAAYTSVGAYTCFREKDLGTLEKGMLADIVVLSGNFPEEISPHADDQSWPSVVCTICDGRVTYCRGDFGKLPAGG